LKALNDTFQINYQNDKYFTIWYGVYNKVKRELIYASAGHPPAILLSGERLKNTEVEMLRTPGIPVGMFPEAKYIDGFCNIKTSSTLYIFSDGAYEITKSDGTIWSLDAFIQLLISVQTKVDSHLDQILNYLMALNFQEAFEDDLSILEIKFN
jgi:sigma-B regulation protein RsbU (phosphoserine phosphatase)